MLIHRPPISFHGPATKALRPLELSAKLQPQAEAEGGAGAPTAWEVRLRLAYRSRSNAEAAKRRLQYASASGLCSGALCARVAAGGCVSVLT